MDSDRTAPNPFRYYARLQRLQTHIEKHYAECIRLADAARIAGLEEKYFSTFFHRTTGHTFHKWLTDLRIEKALALFQQKNHQITEVAFLVGFQDLRTFERAFKKRLGITALDFKKSVRPDAGRRS